MALNLYMHSRNPYKTKKPSFRTLAQKYPFFSEAFSECEDGKSHSHFKQPRFLAALARALLMEDFGLDVEVPLDRLIPTIPLRLNYVLWVEDILAALSPCCSPPKVLDIGTGSCCIYPIIGAKKNGWHFFASEIIRVHDDTAPPLQQVFDNILPSQIIIDVVIANPPFFENVVDAIGADSTRSFARPPPKSTSSAARNESQTVGGEVGFARRLAEDSLRYRDNVKVFTIMLGKKRSVPAVRRIMKEMGITRSSVYEMCQGRVMRWGFAWTFLPNFQFPCGSVERSPNPKLADVSEFKQKRKFHRPPLTYTLPPTMSVILQKNKRSMGGCHLRAKAKEDTWTHSRRKRREALLKQKQSELQQHKVSQAENGERKRPLSTGDDSDPDENPAKRCRMDEVCDGGMSWIEELCEDYTDIDGEVILVADFYVESQQKGYGGDSSSEEDGDFSNSDEEDNEDGVGECQGQLCEKMDATDGESGCDRLIISVNWIAGADREQANRVLCYLKNRLR
ncbi:unnamed protein product [Rodentolepis nana]|uniref:U6 small nuclear RNA (adenine-(43)-N(6))-methyltransferase n=1 Tax=Rodentolepis nana TaxID=102285 RepID=A0A0R3T330_RODNA|nr:unnamed protein product [Rodentolepis nana]